MATCNFHKNLASNYYTVSDDFVEYDMDYLVDEAESNGYEASKGFRGSRRDEMVYAGKNIYVNYGKSDLFEVCLEVILTVNGGYYEGANLDFDIDFGSCVTGCHASLSKFDSVDEAIDFILDSVKEEAEFDKVWYNKGLLKTHEARIRKTYKQAIERAIREADTFCNLHCEETYSLLGVFSNGEAVYQKVG